MRASLRSWSIGTACLLVGVGLGVMVPRALASPSPARTPTTQVAAKVPAPVDHSRYRKLDAFARALAIVERQYVRAVDGDALIQAALTGMIAELDPHSVYLPPQEARLLREDIRGRFGGVGLVVHLALAVVTDDATARAQGTSPSGGEAVVDAPSSSGSGATGGHASDDQPAERVLQIRDVIPDSPAANAGLRVGDEITRVEGRPISSFTDLEAAILVLRGEPGTTVRFSYRRPGGHESELTIRREIVTPPAVQVTYLGEGLGVLRLRDFQEASSREMVEGLASLREQADGDLRGVVIDLRDNGGGLLDEAIRIVDLFVAHGTIVSTRGRGGRVIDVARAHAAGTERHLPLAVLINKASASASEIVAGALQDHRRALIVGERSYGKGSVQAPFELGDGSILKLTTSLYYTPADRLIQASGIAPDVEVGIEKRTMTDSRPELEPERAHPRHLDPRDFGRVEPEDRGAVGAVAAAGDDAQLVAAVEHLRAWVRLDRRGQRRDRGTRPVSEAADG